MPNFYKKFDKKINFKMGKRPISATIDDKLIKWIDEELKDSNKYRNKSHLIEIALNNLKQQNKNKKRG